MHRQPDPSLNIPPEYQHLIWFALPNDAIERLAPNVGNDGGIPVYPNPTLFSQSPANTVNISPSLKSYVSA